MAGKIVFWLPVFIVGISTLNLQGQIKNETWRLESARIEPGTGEWRGFLHAELTRMGDARNGIKVEGPVVSIKIDLAYVSDDRLVLLGEAGRTQAVEIFDIDTGQKRDWFFCYSPQRISDSMIASVEYYPSMTAETPTDVLLIYDLSKTPLENRLDKSSRIPPQRKDRPVQVGIPVFPESNAEHRSYLNHVESEAMRYAFAGSVYKMLTGSELAFAALRDLSGGHRKMELVLVNLADGPDHARSKIFPVADELAKYDVTGIKESRPGKIELTLSLSGQAIQKTTIAIE